MVEMKNKLPAEEGNPETNQNNNQQQQNQTATRTVKVSVIKKGSDPEVKIGSASIMIGTISGETGVGGGQATLSNVPEGTQNITVTATGYKNYSNTIVIGASTPDPVVVELEEE